MKTLIHLGLGLLVSSSPVFAFGVNNGSRIDGFDKYCFYSDGGALTVGSTDLLSHLNAGADGQIDIQKSFGFGGLTDQRVKGFYRYCSYTNGAIPGQSGQRSCPITSE